MNLLRPQPLFNDLISGPCLDPFHAGWVPKSNTPQTYHMVRPSLCRQGRSRPRTAPGNPWRRRGRRCRPTPEPFWTIPGGEGSSRRLQKKAAGWHTPPSSIDLALGGGGGLGKKNTFGWIISDCWAGPPPPGRVPFAQREAQADTVLRRPRAANPAAARRLSARDTSYGPPVQIVLWCNEV